MREVFQFDKDTTKNVAKDQTVGKAIESGQNEIEQIGNTTQNPLSKNDQTERFFGVTSEKSIIGLQSRKNEDVSLVENSNFKLNTDDIVSNTRDNNNGVVSGITVKYICVNIINYKYYTCNF